MTLTTKQLTPEEQLETMSKLIWKATKFNSFSREQRAWLNNLSEENLNEKVHVIRCSGYYAIDHDMFSPLKENCTPEEYFEKEYNSTGKGAAYEHELCILDFTWADLKKNVAVAVERNQTYGVWEPNGDCKIEKPWGELTKATQAMIKDNPQEFASLREYWFKDFLITDYHEIPPQIADRIVADMWYRLSEWGEFKNYFALPENQTSESVDIKLKKFLEDKFAVSKKENIIETIIDAVKSKNQGPISQDILEETLKNCLERIVFKEQSNISTIDKTVSAVSKNNSKKSLKGPKIG